VAQETLTAYLSPRPRHPGPDGSGHTDD
jgi:hypothetical protein